MKRYIFVCLCLVYLEPATIAIDSELINNGDEKISGSFNTQMESSIQEKNEKLETNFNSEDHTSEEDGMLSRKKRYVALGFCISFPLCCDIKGKDQCAFFCPVCPIKRDYFGRPITTTTQNPIKALLAQGPTKIEELANVARKLGRGGAADKLEQLADLARLRSAVGGSGAGDSGGGLAEILGGGIGSSSQANNGQAGSDDGPQLPEGASLSQILPAICARPEIIKNLIRKDPDKVRALAQQFGFGDLPENLTPENLDLTPICGAPGEPRPKGFFGLPDLFANETVDVQGFGDYDYDDDEEYEDYDGDFEGENDLSNIKTEDDEDLNRRKFHVRTPYKIRKWNRFISDSPINRNSFRSRLPKKISTHYGYIDRLDTLQAPRGRKKDIKEKPTELEISSENQHPDVIALVDDQYIRDNIYPKNQEDMRHSLKDLSNMYIYKQNK